nr:hypothetical protein [Tanacetum cinerariifolium]
MSSYVILISTDSFKEKAATVAFPVRVLDLVIHSTTKSDPSEDPPSLNHAPVTPIIYPFLSDDHSESDSKNVVLSRSSPSSGSLSHSIPIPSTEVVTTFALPTPFVKVAATPVIRTPSIEAIIAPSVVPTLPTRDTPTLITDTTHTPCIIPKGNRVTVRKKVRGYKHVMTPIPLPKPSPSSSEVSSSEVSSSSSSFGSSYSSSSFETSSGNSSTFNSPISSLCYTFTIYISRTISKEMQRFRGFLTASPREGSIEDSIRANTKRDTEAKAERDTKADSKVGAEAYIKADVEAGIEDDVKDSIRDTIEITVDFVAEPGTPSALPVLTVAERLEEHEEEIQGMHDYLLEMPAQRLEEIKDEQRILRERIYVVELKRIALCAKVRSLEISELRLRDTLREEREMLMLGMTPKAIEELIAQHMAEALATYEANLNIRNIVEGVDENDNGNRVRNGNGNGNRGGNENGNGNNNHGSGNHKENVQDKMSRDVITVGLTMRILLLYRGEYSQWHESVTCWKCIERTSYSQRSKICTTKEKKTRKIDHLARSLLIQGLPNDIYSLINSNETAKDLWDALKMQMRGSEYGEQDRKAVILYKYETFKAIAGEQLLDTYLCYLQVINDLKKCGYKKDNCELNYKFLNNMQPEWKQYGTLMKQTKNLMDINIDALYNNLKQNQGDVNDALGYKKKAVVVTSDPLALVAEKIKVSKNKEKVVVFSNSEDDKKEDKKADDKKRDMSKVKCYNCKKEGHFAKDCKKAKVKDYNYYKTKMLLAKKDSDKQVLFAEDQAWMESSSDSDQEINANMVFMAQIEKVLSDSDESSSSVEETIVEVAYYTSESESESEFETSEYYDNSTNYGLFVNDNNDQEIFHDAIESASENFIENHIDSQKDYDKFEVDHNDSEEKNI